MVVQRILALKIQHLKGAQTESAHTELIPRPAKRLGVDERLRDREFMKRPEKYVSQPMKFKANEVRNLHDSGLTCSQERKHSRARAIQTY